jgi:hypothetical protein
MIRKVLLWFGVLYQCSSVVSQSSYMLNVMSSKLETLPSNTRMIPGDYVVMVPSTVTNDQFIVTLNDYELSPMNILYVYNHTISSTTSSDHGISLQGLALSNVSDVALQGLLDSDLVATIVPVRWNRHTKLIFNTSTE